MVVVMVLVMPAWVSVVLGHGAWSTIATKGLCPASAPNSGSAEEEEHHTEGRTCDVQQEQRRPTNHRGCIGPDELGKHSGQRCVENACGVRLPAVCLMARVRVHGVSDAPSCHLRPGHGEEQQGRLAAPGAGRLKFGRVDAVGFLRDLGQTAQPSRLDVPEGRQGEEHERHQHEEEDVGAEAQAVLPQLRVLRQGQQRRQNPRRRVPDPEHRDVHVLVPHEDVTLVHQGDQPAVASAHYIEQDQRLHACDAERRVHQRSHVHGTHSVDQCTVIQGLP
mmetsp:Transcript_19601/g.51993  ORF Transcript_19601/g.51993 Transcript_19601/m.51993 type:complete len:277 (+) Transcript_19601:271-1101(+)